MDAAELSDKQTTNTAAPLSKSLLQTTEVKESTKEAKEKLVVVERQVTGSSRAAVHALRQLNKALQ